MRSSALLVLALGVGCAGGAPPPRPAAPASTSAASFKYTRAQVADGIHVFRAPEPRSGLVTGNILAVIGDDGVLVVDSGHFPSRAREVIAEIRALTKKPVRFVVNTHWHSDHVFGNVAYREAFPDVVFMAHAETRRLVLKNDPPAVDRERHIREQLPKLRARLAAGLDRDGKPLDAAGRRLGADLLADAEAVAEDLERATLVPPTLTFDQSTSIDLGRREVRVMHLGRANTAGDAVVYVPDAKVLANGDIVVRPVPYAYDGYMTEWVAVLKRLMAMDAAVIVPGHGEVMHDFAYVRTVSEMLESVVSQVRDARKDGATLEQVRAKVDLERFRAAFAGDDPYQNFVFRTSFVDGAVKRAYEEQAGALSEE